MQALLEVGIGSVVLVWVVVVICFSIRDMRARLAKMKAIADAQKLLDDERRGNRRNGNAA